MPFLRGRVALSLLQSIVSRSDRRSPGQRDVNHAVAFGTGEDGAAKALASFARQQGYRLDELVEIIEDVG